MGINYGTEGGTYKAILPLNPAICDVFQASIFWAILSFPKWNKGTKCSQFDSKGGTAPGAVLAKVLAFPCLVWTTVTVSRISKHVHQWGKNRRKTDPRFFFVKSSTAPHRVMYANETETPVPFIHLWHFLSVQMCRHGRTWHFMTLCGSTFFCLPHIFTHSQKCPPSKGFLRLQIWVVITNMQLGMWHGVKPFSCLFLEETQWKIWRIFM